MMTILSSGLGMYKLVVTGPECLHCVVVERATRVFALGVARQVLFQRKSRAARATNVRTLVFVHGAHVPLEVVIQDESRVAHVAHKLTILRVCAEMVFEVDALCEGSRAVWT